MPNQVSMNNLIDKMGVVRVFVVRFPVPGKKDYGLRAQSYVRIIQMT